MNDLKLSAKRLNGVISVKISGLLTNSCQSAELYDIYPGGSIVFVVDPGSAQIFIHEGIKPNSEVCTDALVPWTCQTKISDSSHSEVCCLVNNKEIMRTNIQELNSKEISEAIIDTKNSDEQIADLVSSHKDLIIKNIGWEYRVSFNSKGTKSESADGILLYNGKLITSKQDGEIIDTAFGKMKYHIKKSNAWDPIGWIINQQYVTSYNFAEIQNSCLFQFRNHLNISLQDTNDCQISFLTTSNCRVLFNTISEIKKQ
jgi:hypothetical protein